MCGIVIFFIALIPDEAFILYSEQLVQKSESKVKGQVRPVSKAPEIRSLGSFFPLRRAETVLNVNLNAPSANTRTGPRFTWFFCGVVVVLGSGAADPLWLFLQTAAVEAPPVTETRAGSPRGSCQSIPPAHFGQHSCTRVHLRRRFQEVNTERAAGAQVMCHAALWQTSATIFSPSGAEQSRTDALLCSSRPDLAA